MSTLSEKLQLTLATKQNIKRAIENKGISVGDIPFSEYPSKIESIGITSEEWKKQDWHDIQQIRLLDTENYLYKSIYLLDNTEDIILLQGGDAYKTSDSNELITEGGEYTFTGAGDLECSEGYKTRWVIVYKNSINNNQLDYFQDTLLYTIQDGINTLQNFTNCYKLRYVECQDGVTTIDAEAFRDCYLLLWVSNTRSVTLINNYAFRGCTYLKGIEPEENYQLGINVFQDCLNIDTLVLRNVTIQFNSLGFCHIKKLILGHCSTSLCIPEVEYIHFDEDYTDPISTSHTYSAGMITGSGNTPTVSTLTRRINTNIKQYTNTNLNTSAKMLNRFDFEELTVNIGISNMPTLKKLNINNNNGGTTIVSNNANLTELYTDETVTYLNTLTNLPKLRTLKAQYTTSLYSLQNLAASELSFPNVTQLSQGSSSSGGTKIFVNLPNATKIELPNLSNIPTQYLSFLQNCPKLKTIDISKITALPGSSITNCGFESLTIPKSVTTLGISAISSLPNLTSLIFEDGYNGTYNSSQLFYSTASYCPELEYIYLPASITRPDSVNATTSYHIGNNCPKLTTIELGEGYSKTLYLKHITTLTKECIVNMLNALADLTGGTTQTLYIYSGTLALLSDEEKAIATNKNWTLAS